MCVVFSGSATGHVPLPVPDRNRRPADRCPDGGHAGGRSWVQGNGGQDLEQSPNASARQVGHVEDKQWIAVNDIAGSPYQDHVYAMWSVFNSSTTKIPIAVSHDRGQTFSKAVAVTAASPTRPQHT